MRAILANLIAVRDSIAFLQLDSQLTEPGRHGMAEEAPHEQRSLLRRLADFFFGYDYFISYAWADGRSYAVALARDLEALGFECFLDSSDYGKGENWKVGGRRAIRKTSRLILVGSAGALASDSVLREVEAFQRTGRTIVPVDFEGTLFPEERAAAVFQFLAPENLAILEARDRLAIGPSEQTLQELLTSFDLQRQDKKRLRWLSAMAAILTALLLATAGAAWGFFGSATRHGRTSPWRSPTRRRGWCRRSVGSRPAPC